MKLLLNQENWIFVTLMKNAFDTLNNKSHFRNLKRYKIHRRLLFIGTSLKTKKQKERGKKSFL